MEKFPSFELDCNSEAWLKGHTDGLRDFQPQQLPYATGTEDAFNYKDGWLTGYCERES